MTHRTSFRWREDARTYEVIARTAAVIRQAVEIGSIYVRCGQRRPFQRTSSRLQYRQGSGRDTVRQWRSVSTRQECIRQMTVDCTDAERLRTCALERQTVCHKSKPLCSILPRPSPALPTDLYRLPMSVLAADFSGVRSRPCLQQSGRPRRPTLTLEVGSSPIRGGRPSNPLAGLCSGTASQA
ncbi:hypothetical protein BV25DRAFT_1821239 [Artomyces pyxidatus]|uniref:Uncharacterized protein n=1 Tax=Artomyces pyxidatus TaxID=48021 RepID=A0ACB8TDB6_9AGAM|nr:hypothetical protein BV25DRAFT_1821239 [Artomyces pyxidatus]